MSETTQICPECGSTHLRHRSGGRGNPIHKGSERFRCGSCDATFEQPDEREIATTSEILKGTPLKLHRAEIKPDETIAEYLERTNE